MPKKGENIYKRKDKRWEGRYKKGRKETGAIRYGYIYGKSYSEVKERLYTEKIKYQSLIELNGESTITYEAYCSEWLERRKIILKKSTYATYQYKLKKYVFPYIGNLPLNQISRETIQSLIYTWTNHTLQSTTIHVTYQIMKQPLFEAYQEKMIKKFPCKDVLLPKKQQKKITSISRREEVLIETQVKKMPLVQTFPVLLGLKAGLRIGEVAALKWEDIDLKNRIIKVQDTYQRIPTSNGRHKSELLLDASKTTRSVRKIPISQNLYKWLKKGKRKALGPYVCSETQSPREPRLITYHFHQLLKKCGLQNIHFHQLRHTFATRCLEAQGNITAISALLGHASAKMTLDTYTNADIISLRETISRKERAEKKRSA
ncbi:tyrosine-type recombinase/integrase [Enterococcus gilvus]|uniref:tyrosine-type recombinase/integrase n=1 Tax=Enterococcus gilvus TaxID=160453 RepID=UPI00345E8733